MLNSLERFFRSPKSRCSSVFEGTAHSSDWCLALPFLSPWTQGQNPALIIFLLCAKHIGQHCSAQFLGQQATDWHNSHSYEDCAKFLRPRYLDLNLQRQPCVLCVWLPQKLCSSVQRCLIFLQRLGRWMRAARAYPGLMPFILRTFSVLKTLSFKSLCSNVPELPVLTSRHWEPPREEGSPGGKWCSFEWCVVLHPIHGT